MEDDANAGFKMGTIFSGSIIREVGFKTFNQTNIKLQISYSSVPPKSGNDTCILFLFSVTAVIC